MRTRSVILACLINGLKNAKTALSFRHNEMAMGSQLRGRMKILSSAALLLSLCASATAGSSVNTSKLRVADAATGACFANCAAQTNSCKRTWSYR
jgi:hypothetical protein